MLPNEQKILVSHGYVYSDRSISRWIDVHILLWFSGISNTKPTDETVERLVVIREFLSAALYF